MKNRTRRRVLAFEQLESKATPSSLLLILAPMDDHTHVVLEHARLSDDSTESSVPASDIRANWQFSLSTTEILRFVDANTSHTNTDSFASPMPTVEHCRCADEMMRLGDVDVRTLVIAESLNAH